MPGARKPRRFVPETPKGGDFLDRDDILGELIVFTVLSVEENYRTKAGDLSDKTVVRIKVLTGAEAGREEDEFFMFGNMAKNAALVPVGETAGAIVSTGESKRGGSWYGLDFELSADEEAMVDAAL